MRGCSNPGNPLNSRALAQLFSGRDLFCQATGSLPLTRALPQANRPKCSRRILRHARNESCKLGVEFRSESGGDYEGGFRVLSEALPLNDHENQNYQSLKLHS